MNNPFKEVKGLINESVSAKNITATKCWNKTIFNKYVPDLNDIVKEKIDDIVTLITYKIENRKVETSIIIPELQYQEGVYDEVVKFFEDAGFIVLRKVFPEIGNNRYIIISWEKGGKVEKTE